MHSPSPSSRHTPGSSHQSNPTSAFRTFHLIARETHVLPPRLLMIHNPRRGSQDDLAKRPSRQQQVHPGLNYHPPISIPTRSRARKGGPTVVDGDVEAGGDDAGLVESPIQLDHHFPAAMVVDDLEFADVACRAEPSEARRSETFGSGARRSGARESISKVERGGEQLVSIVMLFGLESSEESGMSSSNQPATRDPWPCGLEPARRD